ncbi:hypothetical protein [Rossellomorea aquimaris]|uniref:hypothetical protein n=1 Tax=Rossellomorea aquimaris TaxID=189382 RepID=UPI0007D09BD1|nr:hypothetical protein [Rossellomorea aquimaris]
MKKSLSIILLTISIEAIVFWIVSLAFGWKAVDTFFVGGLVTFCAIWLFTFFTKQSSNQFNAGIRGWTGQDAGEIKAITFGMGPVKIGLVLFILINFIFAFIYY